MRRVVGPVVLLFLAGALLAGCSAGSDTSEDSGGGSLADAPTGLAGPDAADGKAADDAAPAADRQVVTSGSVGIIVADPAAAAQEASELVESAGGRVDERVEQAASDDGAASARLIVRIPSARLTETLDGLKALGAVDRVQLTATDVTDTTRDLDARISALKVSVGRLETLLGSATSSDDLLALESALSTRQSELESMQAQRAGLAGQVALATITLDLWPEGTVAAGGPDGFWSGIVTGWGSLLTALTGALIAVGVLLPWAAFLGVLGAATLMVIRFVRRRRAPAPVAATAPTTGEHLGKGWSQGDSNP